MCPYFFVVLPFLLHLSLLSVTWRLIDRAQSRLVLIYQLLYCQDGLFEVERGLVIVSVLVLHVGYVVVANAQSIVTLH